MKMSLALSAMMFFTIISLIKPGEGACAWPESQYPCDEQSHCSYGCKEGLCWSQCGGACAFFEGRKKCYDLPGCREWCYLEKDGKYYPCVEHTDCVESYKYTCKGACTW
ncbi:hypothetical protein ACHWQZ_G012998 [Mnemiopsis leidyi]